VEILRKVKVMMLNLVQRGVVDRSSSDGASCQVKSVSGRVTPDVEILQGQGLHFRPGPGAEGVTVAPMGLADNAVLLGAGARKSLPADTLAAGEGGLHYLGAFKVFLAADGTLSLGAKDAGDYVALASKVDQAIATLQSAIQAGFTAGGGSGPAYAGGAAQKTAFDSALLVPPGMPDSTASETVKAD